MTNEEAINVLRHIAGSYGDVSKYYDAICLAISALERDRWISVEGPPEETGRYLVRYLRDIDIEDGIHDDRIVIMRFLKNSGWRYPLICNKDVRQCVTMEAITHWKTLPEPPKEDKP
jgi:hypothetical protein